MRSFHEDVKLSQQLKKYSMCLHNRPEWQMTEWWIVLFSAHKPQTETRKFNEIRLTGDVKLKYKKDKKINKALEKTKVIMCYNNITKIDEEKKTIFRVKKSTIK